LSPNKETGLRSRVAGDGLDTGRHAFNAIAGFQCKSVICRTGFALRRRLLRLQHVGINVCRALLTLNSRASDDCSRASDDCLAYSVLFRLVVITNTGLAWSASLGRVMTVIVHPSD
jgi:hypothetical protein